MAWRIDAPAERVWEAVVGDYESGSLRSEVDSEPGPLYPSSSWRKRTFNAQGTQ